MDPIGSPPRGLPIPRRVLALVLGLLVIPARGVADELLMDPAARVYLDRGAQDFSAKRYGPAIEAFEAGYHLEPRVEFLFAWAQAERLRGNCAAAVKLYRQLLEKEPTRQQAELTRYHLNNCEALLPRPWYKNVVGGALAATGLGLIAAGAGLFAASNEAEKATITASTYPAYSSAYDTGYAERVSGIVGLAVGGALVVGSITAYVIGRNAVRADAAKRPRRGGNP